LSGGDGAYVTDVDGIERIDFHNGFGSTIHGHGNPAIAEAVRARYLAGSQFGAPVEDAVAVAEDLSRRWGLPGWRFCNSGTEAVGDAIRIARALNGRVTVVRAAGGYHGVGVAEDETAVAVPFNDLGALRDRLEELEGSGTPAACVLLEPALMLGCVLPEPGYLEAATQTAREAGALMIFDEAKTGLAIAAGGARERFGVEPDLVVLAKALGGGLPAAAVGGRREAMALVESGEAVQAGTFNGNPLAMAAARAALLEVFTESAYEGLQRSSADLVEGLDELSAAVGFEATAIGLGARGSIVFAAAPVLDEETFAAAWKPRLERLLWLYCLNRGIYLTPARPQNWTISVAHGRQEIDAYLAVFAELLAELSGKE
jgi:glutamate-1-semialdehyde 2,1-aminomutase